MKIKIRMIAGMAAFLVIMMTACAPRVKDESSLPDESGVTNSTTEHSEASGDTSQPGGINATTSNDSAVGGLTNSTGTGVAPDSTAANHNSTGNSPSNPTTPVVTGSPSKNEIAALCDDIIQTEGARLAGYVLSNGALPMYNISGGGTSKLSPYFSCSAALGLLEAGYINEVKSYIKWHIAHLETNDVSGLNGSIYDYEITVKNGKITEAKLLNGEGQPDYDSVDSYAALFLTLLKEYVVKTGDKAFVKAYRGQIDRIYSTFAAVQNGNLTYAKPTYKMEYLMDNCEVVLGCRDAAYLYRTVFSDEAAAAKCDSLADIITAGVNSLWNSARSNYNFAKGHPSNWTKFYPDVSAQLFPVAFGVVSPENPREKAIYNEFKQEFPSWVNLTSDAFPWVILTRASLAHKDYETTATFLKNVKKKYIDAAGTGWYCQESGLTIWAAAKLKVAV